MGLMDKTPFLVDPVWARYNPSSGNTITRVTAGEDIYPGQSVFIGEDGLAYHASKTPSFGRCANNPKKGESARVV